MTTRLALWLATALCAAFSAVACHRAPDVPKIACPPGTEIWAVTYPAERGGGRGERCVLPGQVREGPSYDYYDDGSIHSITNWSNGSRHGKSTIWHRNGVKAAELEHDHYVAVGTWRTWDEEGRLISEVPGGQAAESTQAGALPEASPSSEPSGAPPAAGS